MRNNLTVMIYYCDEMWQDDSERYCKKSFQKKDLTTAINYIKNTIGAQQKIQDCTMIGKIMDGSTLIYQYYNPFC